MNDRRDALREALIRALAEIEQVQRPNTEPGGWWDKRIEPLYRAALAAEPLALDWAMLDVIKADVERWRRDHPRTEWAPKPPAEYARLAREAE
jgi:hypothetical protein